MTPMVMRTVCSPVNSMKKATPGLTPKPLRGANPSHAPVYEGGGGSSSKLSPVGRHAPGTLIDGQISVASDARK
jgi:hypothetical protein